MWVGSLGHACITRDEDGVGAMTNTTNLRRLQHYFSNADIDWKPVKYTKDRRRAMAVPYITNRAIMDRLDLVCGPENWCNQFKQGPDGGVLCGLSIRVGEQWITKWDGASNTDIEAVKGGLTSSMRRAAVQWGIGRYLYRLPAQWVSLDEKGRFLQHPSMPPSFHPAYSGDDSETPSLRPMEAGARKSMPRPTHVRPVPRAANA